MKQIFFGILTIIAVKSVQQLDKQCECANIIYQYDCAMDQKCNWNGTACNDIQCSDIHYYAQCLSNPQCYYTNNNCKQLTDCEVIANATSSETCAQQSIHCGSYNDKSKQCQPFTVQQCNKYEDKYDCAYAGNGQLCIWSNNGCTDFLCSLLTNEQCLDYSIYCSLIVNKADPTTYTCVDATCDTKPTSSCTAAVTYGDLTTIQPCYVDSSSNPARCRDASLSDLTYVTCGINTLYTASWNSNLTTSGECKSCFDMIIQLGLVLITLFVQ